MCAFVKSWYFNYFLANIISLDWLIYKCAHLPIACNDVKILC